MLIVVCGNSLVIVLIPSNICLTTVESLVVFVTEVLSSLKLRYGNSEPGDVHGSEKKEKVVVEKEKPKCEDKNLFCGYWAKIGECSSDSKFMKIFCKASCKRCQYFPHGRSLFYGILPFVITDRVMSFDVATVLPENNKVFTLSVFPLFQYLFSVTVRSLWKWARSERKQ